MNYTFVPSLEHITLIKIVVTLWNGDDVGDLVSEFFYVQSLLGKRKSEWEKIENKIVEKVSKLPSAKPLKEKLLYFIIPVGLQILAWLDFHDHHCSFIEKIPGEFFWTTQGTIDKEKSAKVLVNDESLDIYERYTLACTYCLEDHIHILWKQLLKDPYKEDLLDNKIDGTPLVSFWFHYLDGEIGQLENIMKEYCGNDNVTPYEYAFRLSAASGNEAATRYFLQKLTPEEKEKNLVRTTIYVVNRHSDFYDDHTHFPKEYYTDVLCFLLLQIDEEQQIQVFISSPYRVLTCFLHWAWQSFFVKTVEHMFDILCEEYYCRLLNEIIWDMNIKEYNSFNYRELFRETWQRSRSTHKNYAIYLCISGGLLLSKLFELGDEDSIKLIFKDASAAEREKLIFCKGGKEICQKFIYDGKWVLLKFVIRECISSKNVIMKFKEEFKEFIVSCLSRKTFEKEADLWNTFYRLLDDFFKKDDEKRSVGEDDSSPKKRLCSLTSEQLSSSKEILKG